MSLRGKHIIGSLLVGSLLLTGCTNTGQSSTTTQSPAATSSGQASTKLQVITSIYPVADFAKQVAGDYAEVTNLVPPGVEPHDWEPTAKDIQSIAQADVFVYNGGGLENWVPNALESTKNEKQVVVETAKGLQLMEGIAEEGEQHEGEEHGYLDPHIWLDPVLAQKQVAAIEEGLEKADPAHKAEYQKNANAYIEKLKQLDKKFADTFSNVKRKELVTQHAAFGYLAKRYQLQQIPIAGLSPDVEPSPSQLVEIVNFAREHQVKTIFFETLAAPKVAETVAKEIGATTAVLNPIEGLTEEEQAQHKDYLSVMEENLQLLSKAMNE